MPILQGQKSASRTAAIELNRDVGLKSNLQRGYEIVTDLLRALVGLLTGLMWVSWLKFLFSYIVKQTING